MRTFTRMSRVMTALILGTLLAVSVAFFPAFARAASFASQGTQSNASSCLQPPQNVDLITLSDAALQSYGLPTHAVINENPTFWTQDLAHAKHRSCTTASNQVKTKYSHHFIPSKTPSIHPDWSSSQTWADNEATAGRGTYRAATIEFNVPYISLSDPNAAVSVWAGVGGDENYGGSGAELPQVGVSVNPSGKSQYNESWWEVAGSPTDNGEVNLPLKRLNPGDRVYAYVSSNLNNDGYDYFEIENENINNYNSYTLSGSSYLSDSATGECVVERPTLNGNPVHLAEFDPSGNKTEELDSCEIDNATGYQQSVGNWPHIDYHMFDGGTQLAYPEALFNGGQDFLVQWQHSY